MAVACPDPPEWDTKNSPRGEWEIFCVGDYNNIVRIKRVELDPLEIHVFGYPPEQSM